MNNSKNLSAYLLLFVLLLVFAVLSGCNFSETCDYTCCSDTSCEDGNPQTKDFCVFQSTIDSICANKVENSETLRIEEFARNHIL